MSEERKVLIAVSRGDLLARLRPVLESSPFDVHRAPGGVGALIFAANETYDLVVSELPVPDIDAVEFLHVLRDPSGPSRNASVLFLSDDEALLGTTLERAALEVEDGSSLSGLRSHAPESDLERRIYEAMGVAARRGARLMVELQVSLADRVARWVCQSHDISASGMLLRTDQIFPLGTEVVATFELPDKLEPIAVPALVARHSHPPAECEGMAIQFLGLSEEDWEQLHAFVESLLEGSEEETAETRAHAS